MQLRTYLLIDQMQPQYGALTGKTMQGEIPVEGMAEIYIETAPASDIYKVMDAMGKRGWMCGQTTSPAGIHVMATPVHEAAADAYAAAAAEAIAEARVIGAPAERANYA